MFHVEIISQEIYGAMWSYKSNGIVFNTLFQIYGRLEKQ